MRRLAIAASAVPLLMGLATGPASARTVTFVHGLYARNHCRDVVVTTRYAGSVRSFDFLDAQGLSTRRSTSCVSRFRQSATA